MAISLNCLNTYWFSQARRGVCCCGVVCVVLCCVLTHPSRGPCICQLPAPQLVCCSPAVLLPFFNALLLSHLHALAPAADGHDRPEGRQAQDQGGVTAASWLLFQHGQRGGTLTSLLSNCAQLPFASPYTVIVLSCLPELCASNCAFCAFWQSCCAALQLSLAAFCPALHSLLAYTHHSKLSTEHCNEQLLAKVRLSVAACRSMRQNKASRMCSCVSAVHQLPMRCCCTVCELNTAVLAGWSALAAAALARSHYMPCRSLQRSRQSISTARSASGALDTTATGQHGERGG